MIDPEKSRSPADHDRPEEPDSGDRHLTGDSARWQFLIEAPRQAERQAALEAQQAQQGGVEGVAPVGEGAR